jgi:hypothetical protein
MLGQIADLRVAMLIALARELEFSLDHIDADCSKRRAASHPEVSDRVTLMRLPRPQTS